MIKALNGRTINKDGVVIWYKDGLLHRTDGPAVECPDGYKAWYQNDELHREDGPAVEQTNGYKEWWVNGVKLSEKEFMEITMSDKKAVKPATKKQVNETAVRNAVTVAMENETSKFDFSNIAKLIMDLQDVLKENKQLNVVKEENKALKAEIRTLKKEFHDHSNKMRENQLNLCLALSKQTPQEYFMTIGSHDQAMALDAMANCHGLYMFCLERVDSGKGLESEFRVGFKVQSGNTTPAESMKNFIASFKEVK